MNFPPKKNFLDFKLKTEVQILKLKCPGIHEFLKPGMQIKDFLGQDQY